MENTLYIALSRQTALWRQLDMVANNMANMNTAAYKSEQPLFTEYLVKSPSVDRTFKDNLSFAQDFGTVLNMDEGPIKSTGNPLDVAIKGDGFFVVETPQGEFYSRNGQFKLDSEGQLVNADGYAIMSTDNQPFFIAPGETEINISKDGTVSTENGIIGTLQLVRFDNTQALEKKYGSLYAPGDNNDPVAVENIHVEQGMIEQSNVHPVMEMTKMVQLQRSYGNVQRMIEAEHERQKDAIAALTRRTV